MHSPPALADLTGDAFELTNAARGRHRRAAGICGRRSNMDQKA
jgi:hypothetical protein